MKIEKATARKPEVIRLAVALSIRPDEAFGICFRFWAWCDDQVSDGRIRGFTQELIDATVDRPGFASALISVGWLQARDGSLVIPNFDRHLSQSAKTRAEAAIRKKKERSKHVTKMSQKSVTSVTEKMDENVTIEKRREEKSNTKMNPKKNSCPEVPQTEPSEPSVMEFPTVGKVASWGLTQSKVDEYAATYPALDILAECRKARQWTIDNPANRKTFAGMTRFLNAWMARAQNSGRSNGNRPANSGKSAEHERFYGTLSVLEDFAAGDAGGVREVNRAPLRLEADR